MTMRIAGAILGFLFATTAAYAQTEILIPAPVTDSAEEPTSVPDYCSELGLNCVLNDGPPHRVVFGASEQIIPSTPTPATGEAGGTTAGTAALGASAGATAGSGSAGFAGRR